MSNEESSSSTPEGEVDFDKQAKTRRKHLKEVVTLDDRLSELKAMADALGSDEEGKQESEELEQKRGALIDKILELSVLGLPGDKWSAVKNLVEKNWSKFESMEDYQSAKNMLKGASESLHCANCKADLCAFEHVVHVCTGKQWQWHPKLKNSAVFSLINEKCRTLQRGDDDKVSDMYCGDCGTTVGFRVSTNVDHYCVSENALVGEDFQLMRIELDKKKFQGQRGLQSRIQSMFNIVDADGDGLIRFEEFKQALEGLELKLPGGVQPRELFGQLDKEDKGAIDFYEFRDFCKRIEQWEGANPGDRMRAIFDLVDKNGVGTINLQQFKKAIESMDFDLSESNTTSVFKAIDQTGSGTVTYDEFSTYVKSLAKRYELDPFDELEMDPEERVRMTKMFKEIDTDNSGEIDWDEFAEANKTYHWGWTPDKLQAMWEEIDLDGNGTLEFDEFVKAIRLGNIPCKDLNVEDCGVDNIVGNDHWQRFTDRASTVRDLESMRTIRQATGGRVDMSYLKEDETKAADKSVFSLKNSEPTPPLPKHRLDEVAEHVRQLGKKFDWKIKKKAGGAIKAIPAEKIAKIMKGLGHRPSNQELAEIIAHHANMDGDVDFFSFCQMLRWYEVSVTEDQVVLYFKEFLDDGTGHMTLQKFKTLLEEINEGDMMEEDVADVITLVESIMSGTYKPKQEGRPSEYIEEGQLDDDALEAAKKAAPKIALDEKLSMDQFLTAMRAILFM